MRTILHTAVDDEILLRNPCRIRGAGVARTAERPIATLAQVEALAEAVCPRYRALVLLAAWIGATARSGRALPDAPARQRGEAR